MLDTPPDAIKPPATPTLLKALVNSLGRGEVKGFNVFDVMHHGMHEKQLSNVFAWLLDASGTHGLGSAFVDAFIEDVNEARGDTPLPSGPYVVAQERNTGSRGSVDIADLVLENERARVVIENYYTSDGHGHSFAGYLRYACAGDRQGCVVLLCQDRNEARRTEGWESAIVVTYGQLLDRFLPELRRDAAYQASHPKAFQFLEQMGEKFGMRERRLVQRDLLDFVTAMCDSGEARRYTYQPHAAAHEQFAEHMAELALAAMSDSRRLLQSVLDELRVYCRRSLVPELVQAGLLPEGVKLSGAWQGKYHWAVGIPLAAPVGSFSTDDQETIDIMFGPTAACMQDESEWNPLDQPDYGCLIVGRTGTRELRQTDVSLQQVLDGLPREDTRLLAAVSDLL